MSKEKRLIDELCQIVTTFLCREGQGIDIERCLPGPHLFTKGGTQAVCTIKLAHGITYNIEFVYRFWSHKLKSVKFPFSPCFIISNNGLASTLKCFLCTPRDVSTQFASCCAIDSDVSLSKNTSIILSQDDFIKFKTNLVFAKDLDIFNSMVVFRTYLTEHRQAVQFLVVKAQNSKKLISILSSISEVCADLPDKPRASQPLHCLRPQHSSIFWHTATQTNFFIKACNILWPLRGILTVIALLILTGCCIYWSVIIARFMI